MSDHCGEFTFKKSLPQLWRIFTSVFFFGKFSFNFVFQLYFFSSFSTKLERNEAFESRPGE
jgi:hypothetical protein